MRRVAFAILSFCAVAFIALFAGPTQAGEYYRHDDGYSYRPYHRNVRVWYSSSCCYRRVVRHEARVRYVPVERYGYYGRPYRDGYYDRPYRRSEYERPYHYSDYPYYRSSTVSGWRETSDVDNCYWRRTRVLDGRGGWVWGAARVCH